MTKNTKGMVPKTIESVSMLIPPLTPPPYCERLKLFVVCAVCLIIWVVMYDVKQIL